MEGIAGEAAHTRRLSTGRPDEAGEAIRSGSLDDGLDECGGGESDGVGNEQRRSVYSSAGKR
jgi:hypothetical protein